MNANDIFHPVFPDSDIRPTTLAACSVGGLGLDG